MYRSVRVCVRVCVCVCVCVCVYVCEYVCVGWGWGVEEREGERVHQMLWGTRLMAKSGGPRVYQVIGG